MENNLIMENFALGKTTSLLIIDIQERLIKALEEPVSAGLIRYTSILTQLALDVGSSVFFSEQYPKGLGQTVGELLVLLESAGATSFEKTHFDLCACDTFTPQSLSKTVIVCGMETHICVLATVLSLLSKGHRVLLPIDAVASRSVRNHENGLKLMEKAGAVLVNSETLVFQTLKHSKSDHFKKYSKLIL